ncbi:hypothetical protein J2X20_000896 [Pelomonas saccharophila]|uniref:Uncharacterized protein n=1 Tax=Roseateles saccharophilus TaxID=304 RepID=A0ABU1YHC8_ROSSA|nr:hypothetical protein [Roseateles saccharophilus]MDR7268267.1 hypothetical protein [Roseateles saccharophilus]
MTTMNHDDDKHDDSAFDEALRDQLLGSEEPADDGFSLRVMVALAPKGVTSQQRRWARWVRRAQWTAISVAAFGTTALMADTNGPLDTPHVVAAAALVGLLVFWSVPSRWTRG